MKVNLPAKFLSRLANHCVCSTATKLPGFKVFSNTSMLVFKPMKAGQHKRKRLSIKVKCLSQISIDLLHEMGVRGVIVDLDNTIVSEDDVYLSPHAEKWVEEVKKEGIKLFILSNGKRKYRVAYWSSRLKIPAISPARKPFPFGFRRALEEMKLNRDDVVVIGDSLHTDVLGAFLVGCSSIQVFSLPHPPRWWEKLVGHWVQCRYQDIHELCLFKSEYS